jgi:hypothetical protein
MLVGKDASDGFEGSHMSPSDLRSITLFAANLGSSPYADVAFSDNQSSLEAWIP